MKTNKQTNKKTGFYLFFPLSTAKHPGQDIQNKPGRLWKLETRRQFREHRTWEKAWYYNPWVYFFASHIPNLELKETAVGTAKTKTPRKRLPSLSKGQEKKRCPEKIDNFQTIATLLRSTLHKNCGFTPTNARKGLVRLLDLHPHKAVMRYP